MSLRRNVVGRERWTAIVAALVLVLLGIGSTMVHLPFVIWSAGGLTSVYGGEAGQPGLSLTGAAQYGVSSKLLVANVTVTDQSVGLGQVLRAYSHPNQAVMPQVVSSPVGLPIPQVSLGLSTAEAQRAAEAAALKAVGLPVERAPRIVSVMTSGPSYGLLLPDDVIEMVGSTTVTTVAEFNQAMASYSVADTVQLTVTRDGQRLDSQIDVVAQATYNQQQLPSLGVVLTDSFLLGDVDVRGAPSDIGAGLILAIGVYDLLTPGSLLGDLSVAGAGIVDANGVVSGVAGISERMEAARAGGVDVYLLPRSSCPNVESSQPGMMVVAVGTLSDAIQAIATLAVGGPASLVPTCPA